MREVCRGSSRGGGGASAWRRNVESCLKWPEGPIRCFYPKQVARLKFELIALSSDLPCDVDRARSPPWLVSWEIQGAETFEDQLVDAPSHDAQNQVATPSFVADVNIGQRGIVER